MGLVARAMPQVKSKTTTVRTAVARFESTSLTPILARTAVSPAKRADKTAQKIQFMQDRLTKSIGKVKRGVGVSASKVSDLCQSWRCLEPDVEIQAGAGVELPVCGEVNTGIAFVIAHKGAGAEV